MVIGKEARAVDMLKHLIAIDFNAISAYQSAIDCIESPRCRRALEEFMLDHWRHTQQLAPFVENLGELPPTHADAMSLLTKGRVFFGHIAGDRGVLHAMHTNEDDTSSAYENAYAWPDMSMPLLKVVQRAVLDERRHKEWMERVLGQPQHVPLASFRALYSCST